MFAIMQASGLQALHLAQDPRTGLQAIIAVHNTCLGPALGGCRYLLYPDTASAVADAARLARTEALRAETLRRITGEAGAAGVPTGSGAPGSTGTAAKSAGPSASYAGRIKARIRPNITFADEVSGNPLATVEVKVAPDGTIVGRRLTQSSGVRAWDEAVLRAIDKTEILPRDMDGRVPSSMLIDFRPRE